MSLSNPTIAQPEAINRTGLLKGVALVATGLILGAALGLGVAEVRSGAATFSGNEVAERAMPFEEFIELNTTGLHQIAAVSTATDVAATESVSPFIEWNVDRYHGVAPAATVVATEAAVTAEFMQWNVGSYEGLASLPPLPPQPEPGATDFWRMNVTSLEYPPVPFVPTPGSPS